MATTKPDSAGNGRGNTLPPKQEAAALALAAGKTIEAAARSAGAGARTVRTWLAEQPAFSRRVGELRSEMTSRALGRLVDGMTFAADAIRKLLAAKSESVRLAAARCVLEFALKIRDATELEQRIAALEAGRGGKR